MTAPVEPISPDAVEHCIRGLAQSLPVMDFGSTQAIKAVSSIVRGMLMERDATIATLTAALAAAEARAMLTWQPIETARTAGHRRFLCWDAHYGLRIGTVHVRADHDDWLSYVNSHGGSSKGGIRATHWMPLPPLPTLSQAEG